MATKIVGVIKSGPRHAKPVVSFTKTEARARVLKLYRAWYRYLPKMLIDFDLPVTHDDLKGKLREKFEANRHVTDIRTIDLLVTKGEISLVEIVNVWAQKSHIMRYFEDTWNERPARDDFMAKFYDGHDP